MPKERSIAKRLSGGEALNSLCHRIRTALEPRFPQSGDLDILMRGIWLRLAAHGHFHGHKGYHGYSATVRIVVSSGFPAVDLIFRPAISYAPPLTDAFALERRASYPDLDVSIEIPVRPPNAVRMESEMPLPVEVEEAGQIVEKMVPAAKYKGKIKKGTARPRTENMEVPTLKGKLSMPDGAIEKYGIQGR